jgi:hypothetical protein
MGVERSDGSAHRTIDDWIALAILTLVTIPVFGGLVVGLGGVAVASVRFWTDGSWKEAGPMALAFGVMFLSWSAPLSALLAWVFWKSWIKRRTSERRLGPVAIDLEPAEPRAGERVVVRARIRPRVELRVGEGEAELLGVVQDRPSASEVHFPAGVRTLYRETRSLDTRRDLAPGEPFAADAAFAIPLGALPSEDGARIVHWTVTVRIAVDRWPGWERMVPLTVRPPA